LRDTLARAHRRGPSDPPLGSRRGGPNVGCSMPLRSRVGAGEEDPSRPAGCSSSSSALALRAVLQVAEGYGVRLAAGDCTGLRGDGLAGRVQTADHAERDGRTWHPQTLARRVLTAWWSGARLARVIRHRSSSPARRASAVWGEPVVYATRRWEFGRNVRCRCEKPARELEPASASAPPRPAVLRRGSAHCSRGRGAKRAHGGRERSAPRRGGRPPAAIEGG